MQSSSDVCVEVQLITTLQLITGEGSRIAVNTRFIVVDHAYQTHQYIAQYTQYRNLSYDDER